MRPFALDATVFAVLSGPALRAMAHMVQGRAGTRSPAPPTGPVPAAATGGIFHTKEAP